MFVAHMPAGYLLTNFLLEPLNTGLSNNNPLNNEPSIVKKLFIVGLIGSVFPDFDLLYFYLIDNRQHIHHSYWTHIPIFWFLLSGVVLFAALIIKSRVLALVTLVFTANVFLHLVLDSVAGGIYWAYPIIEERFRLFFIPSRFDWWVFNYIFHWTFLMELAIVLAASYVVLAKKISKKALPSHMS
ncbi:metal-dependent hydrolase [Kaarinaea lacus]